MSALDQFYESIVLGSKRHPKSAQVTYSYGTAGFRTKAQVLDPVLYRTGLLAALRSKAKGGQVIGVMITASHNPAEDNGVKLVDPYGEMLEASWEAYATLFANAKDEDALLEAIRKVVSATKLDLNAQAVVIQARDTRPSGTALSQALTDGLNAFEAESTDYELKTTPQLHYLVRCLNTQGTNSPYGDPTQEGYYEKMATAFRHLMQGKKKPSRLTVDCANGVGAPKLAEFMKVLGDDYLEIKLVNVNIQDPKKLNYQCGADYVKTQQKFPPGAVLAPLERWCSLDGDADRLMYYYVDTDGFVRLLDGDKIASLSAMFIMDLVKAAGVEIKVGVVQTAYANGNSTSYLTKVLKIPVSCTPTGVKYLHHEAQRYDCGVYFEANGHGTILFSPHALSVIESHKPQSPAQNNALNSLKAITQLINQTVGDAISDMLFVEAVLAHKSWGPKEWDSTYTDLPNRLVRVVVSDRTKFKTTDQERKLVEPKGLQERIEGLMCKYKEGRAFVRASGTEEAVRVYAEAGTRSEADELAFKVADLLAGY